MTTLAEYSSSRELLTNLTLRELRGKYKRSLLGWSWSLLNPLSTMVVFTLVFNYILNIEAPQGEPSGLKIFALYLLCALLPWNFVANGLSGSMGALISNSNLIKKVYFPREILVVANVASWIVSLLIELAVLAVVFQILGNFVLPWLPLVALIVLIQAVFVLGLGLLMSVLNVYFRDVQHLVAVVLQIWFYLTPVIYPVDLVPRTTKVLGYEIPARAIYELNPTVRFVEAYRDCLYHLRAPAFADLLFLVATAIVTFAFGLFVFNRLEPKLAEEL